MENNSDLHTITEDDCIDLFEFYREDGAFIQLAFGFKVVSFNMNTSNLIYLN